jgi:hypothetical protein
MAMGCPEAPELLQCLGWQWNIAVFVAFAQVHMDLHTSTVDVSDLQACAFTDTQTAGVNRTQADPIMGSA